MIKKFFLLVLSLLILAKTPSLACDISTGTVTGPSNPTVGVSVTYSWNHTCGVYQGYGNSINTNPNFTVTSASPNSVTGFWNSNTTATVSFWHDCSPGGIGYCSATNLSVTSTGGCSDTGSGTTWNWTGDTDKDWFTACNWDRNSVPNCNSDVVIDGTAPVQPEITGATALCNTIEINSSAGGRLDLISSSSGVLTIKSVTGTCP